MELQKLPMRPTHRAVELLVEKTKLSGALRPPFHSTPVCLPGAPWRSLPWFVPFLLVFISPNLSFLSPFPNICLTFCQPARRGEADPREYCLAKEGGIWAQRLLCLGVEHTQQGAGAWFAAPNAFFFLSFAAAQELKEKFSQSTSQGLALSFIQGKPCGLLLWGFQRQSFWWLADEFSSLPGLE